MTRSFRTGPADDPDRYEVVAPGDVPVPEGAGGAEGYVYRALDHGDPVDGAPRPVALKLLVHLAPDRFAAVAERFAALAEVQHPNLMRVRTAFVGSPLRPDDEATDASEAAACYVVADWVSGRPLVEVVDAASDRVDATLPAVATLARAVHRLHRTTTADAPDGFAHRDVKTSNVLVGDDGRVVLIDYGATRIVSTVVPASLVGTAGFIAPEIAAREAGADPRDGDAYGIGAVAYDLLAGHPPPMMAGAPAAAAEVLRHLGDRPLAAELAHHVASLLEIRPDDRHPDLARWADELELLAAGRPLPRSSRAAGAPSYSRRRVAAFGALAAAIALVTGLVAWWGVDDAGDRSSDRTTARAAGAEAPTPSSAPSTDPSVSVSVSPETTWRCVTDPVLPAGPVGDALRAAFASTEACAGTAEPLLELVGLPLVDRTGRRTGALVASPQTPVVRLTPAQYASYRELAGRSQPTNAPLYGGYPTGVRRDEAAGVTIIDLSSGGLVIGRRDDTQSFWVPAQARGLWEARGGLTGELGLPTSNVFFAGDRLILEFERGYLQAIVRDSDPGTATWLPIDAATTDVILVDGAEALARFPDPRGRVLRQAGGTAWYVDDDRVRHWIADAETWACLDAEQRSVPGDVPGYAMATLELGPPATCSMR